MDLVPIWMAFKLECFSIPKYPQNWIGPAIQTRYNLFEIRYFSGKILMKSAYLD